MVIRNAIVQGWALRGFREYMRRGRGRRLMPEVQAPRNPDGNRRLTPETIARVMESLRGEASLEEALEP